MVAQVQNKEAYVSLSLENQAKVDAIYRVAHIKRLHNHPPITPSFFDKLYEFSAMQINAIVINLHARALDEELRAIDEE
jgi:hypothetical protein